MSEKEVRACHGCGTKDVECEFYSRKVYGGVTHEDWLCEFCANSSVGNSLRYPEQYPYKRVSKDLARMMNILRKDLKGNE